MIEYIISTSHQQTQPQTWQTPTLPPTRRSHMAQIVIISIAALLISGYVTICIFMAAAGPQSRRRRTLARYVTGETFFIMICPLLLLPKAFFAVTARIPRSSRQT